MIDQDEAARPAGDGAKEAHTGREKRSLRVRVRARLRLRLIVIKVRVSPGAVKCYYD